MMESVAVKDIPVRLFDGVGTRRILANDHMIEGKLTINIKLHCFEVSKQYKINFCSV